MELFNSMDIFLKTFWYIAIPTSVIFLIQTVMTFIGMGSSDGIDADFDGDFEGEDTPFQLFSFRNLINFLLGFSWTGISFYQLIENKILLTLLGVLIGCLFIYLFFLVIRALMKLTEDNSFKINEIINKTAEVYLTIPPHKSGKGKITLSVKGSFRELEAMTDGDKIPSNSIVKIVGIENTVAIVEKV
ncbi:NfeD family protein [Capnocytophaga canis]|uniref:NfeD family protein n=1 Tax=Capnocytophaga canis TaxID=1848903 RepID=UPI0037D94259